MKKSTVLIVLLGVLMFGLVGNLFGQSVSFGTLVAPGYGTQVYMDVQLNLDVYRWENNTYVPVPDGEYTVEVYFMDANYSDIGSINFDVINGNVNRVLTLIEYSGYVPHIEVVIRGIDGSYNYEMFDDVYTGDSINYPTYF